MTKAGLVAVLKEHRVPAVAVSNGILSLDHWSRRTGGRVVCEADVILLPANKAAVGEFLGY